MIERATPEDIKMAQYDFLINHVGDDYNKLESWMLETFSLNMNAKSYKELDETMGILFELRGRITGLQTLRMRHENTTEG